MRLIDYFAPVFGRVLALQEEIERSSDRMYERKASEPASRVFRELEERLTQICELAVREGGKQENDVILARKAIIAWIDEAIGWSRHWMGDTLKLQKVFHNSENFGDEFYDFVQEVSNDRAEVAEVFLTVIGLGFRTKYTGAGSTAALAEELVKTRAQLIQRLDRPLVAIDNIRGGASAPEYITEQPYNLTDPTPVKRSGWKKWLLIALAALLSLALLGAGLWYVLTQIDFARDPVIVEEEIGTAMPPIECGLITNTLNDDFSVTVSGFAQSQQVLDQVVAAIRGVDGVTAVTNTAEVTPWPFCRLRALAEDDTVMTDGASNAPQIAVNNPSRQYRDGENIVIDVTNRAGAGYLTVIYSNVNGELLHMLPWAQRTDNSVSPNASVRFGVETPGQATQANPPMTITRTSDGKLGQGMVFAVWTPQRLFRGPREDLADVDSFAASVRLALQGSPAESILVDTVTLDLVE